VSQSSAEIRHQVCVANRICAHEGVLDAFGHVSVRNPENPQRYFLSRSRAPELVEPADIYEFDLDSEPVAAPKERLYSERVIHGEIYKARPDVMAVCHHHSPAILSYCITGEKLLPVYHMGAAMGLEVPFWDQHDEFGDTNMLVQYPAEGASLARALGPHTMVLMKRHGATVAGASLPLLVFQTIYSCRNAEYQTMAKQVGRLTSLSPGEIEMAGRIKDQPNTTSRAWEYWVTRLEKRGEMPARLRTSGRASAKKKTKGRRKR
jgi:HCOMODA/2-hydroxy-3-carboxy-muconic semialdehyde decarboxylase